MNPSKSQCKKKHSATEDNLCAFCNGSQTAQDTQPGHNQKGAKRERGRGRASKKGQISPAKDCHFLFDPRRQQHEKISEMYVRIQRLEHDLGELQKKVSTEPHPLLIGTELAHLVTSRHTTHETRTISKPSQGPVDKETDLLAEAFGVLSMGSHGNGEFHGPTASSEHFLKAYVSTTQSAEGAENDIPEVQLDFLKNQSTRMQAYADLVLLNVQFPCPPASQKPPDMNRFINLLPSYNRARVLLKNYFSYISWSFMPIQNDELEKILSTFYPHHVKTNTLKLSDAHKLGVLFMAFLLGTLYDLDMTYTAASSSAEEYHLLARAALASDPIIEHTTVYAIQALILMICYFRMCPGIRSPSYQWGLSGYLTKLVQAIGLHRNCRDTSLYIQDPNWHRCCEQTFWEYYAMDVWQSYMFGRPASMASCLVECNPPPEVGVYSGLDSAFFEWKYSFARLTSDVITITSSATVSYEDILKCEKLLREHSVPSSLLWLQKHNINEILGKSFQRCCSTLGQHIAVMYLHRPYFWEAVSKYPDDPSRSNYWHSVVMAHSSACTLLSGIKSLWMMNPKHLERMAPFWSHAQSAALVLGALVSQSPGCNFAPNAMRQFTETCDLLCKAKGRSFQPQSTITALEGLKSKALTAFARYHETPSHVSMSVSPAPSFPPDDLRFHNAMMTDHAHTASSTPHTDESEMYPNTPASGPLGEEIVSFKEQLPERNWYTSQHVLATQARCGGTTSSQLYQ